MAPAPASDVTPTDVSPSSTPRRRSRAHAFTLIGGVMLGLAAWVTPGVLAFPGGEDGIRVGLLPPVWMLGLLCVCLTIGLARWGTLASLTAGTAGLLSLVPWLPMPLPASAFLWLGPLAWLPWIGAGLTLIVLARQHLPLGWARSRLAGGRAVFLLSLAVYLGGYSQVHGLLPVGDEPHYLIISQSLLADGDLAIDDNHARREYAAFHAGELPPDFLRRGVDRRIYSIHAPGLPVLLLPAYALLGYPGAVLLLACVAACGAWLLWQLAFDLTGEAGAAWFAWAGAALSVPFVFHTFTIFPDGPAAVLALAGVRGLILSSGLAGRATGHGHAPPAHRGLTPIDALATGAALAALPWLHTRYALVSALLGGFIVAHLWWRTQGWPSIGAVLAVPVVSAVAWFGFFQIVYGTPSPAAPYGGYTQTALAHVPSGVLGLLVDQQFGLLAAAPVMAFAVVGLGLMLARTEGAPRGGRLLGAELALLAIAYLAVSGAYRMWWGGASAPARFLVVLLLPLGLPLAVLWARARRGATRALASAALAASLLFTATFLLVDHGAFAYNPRDGEARWARWASPAVDLASALPSLHRGSVGTAATVAGAWVAAACALWLVLRLWERGGRLTAPWRVAPVALLCGLGASGAASLAWRAGGAAALLPGGSTPWLLERLAARPSQLAVRVEAGSMAGPGWTRVRHPLPLVLVTGRTILDPQGAIEMPALPSGRYRLDVPAASPGALSIHVGGGERPLALLDAPGPAAPPASFELFFPVPVPPWLILSATPGGVPPPVVLHPIALLPPTASLPTRALHAAAYGQRQAFFMDDLAYPEPDGFWVQPGPVTRIVVAQPDGRTPLTLRLHSAPAENEVRLRAGTWRETLTLREGIDRRVVVPPPGSSRTTVLEIQAAKGLRPADADPRNRDTRLLGVWVAFE